MRDLPQVGRGTSRRILDLLRRGPMTVDELARPLSLTRTAVRAQLASLLRDGLVEQRDSRRGASKPSHVYGISSQAELLFSRAYVPLLTQLLHVLSLRTSPADFEAIMHEVGRAVLDGRMARGGLAERVAGAGVLLNELGGLTDVERTDGRYVIRSFGCPLAAATTNHPEVCTALESLLGEYIGTKVSKCCDQYDRVRCCFEIPDSGMAGSART